MSLSLNDDFAVPTRTILGSLSVLEFNTSPVRVETLLSVPGAFKAPSKLSLLGSGETILIGLSELAFTPVEVAISDEVLLTLEVSMFNGCAGVCVTGARPRPLNIAGRGQCQGGWYAHVKLFHS